MEAGSKKNMKTQILVELKGFWYRTLRRFVIVFVISGLASVAVVPPMTNLSYTDLRAWILALTVAFLSGGLAGIEKGYRMLPEYKDEEKPADVQ